MAGINVNGIGRNPYADSYLTSAKNRSNTISKDTFVSSILIVDKKCILLYFYLFLVIS